MTSTSETPTRPALDVEALAEALDAYDALMVAQDDGAVWRLRRARAVVIDAARRVAAAEGGDVPDRPTPAADERTKGLVWGAIRPFLTCLEPVLHIDRQQAMAEADVMAVEIADAVLAAAGGAVAVPPATDDAAMHALREALKGYWGWRRDDLAGDAVALAAVLNEHSEVLWAALCASGAVAVPEDRPAPRVTVLDHDGDVSIRIGPVPTSDRPTTNLGYVWGPEGMSHDDALTALRAALGDPTAPSLEAPPLLPAVPVWLQDDEEQA